MPLRKAQLSVFSGPLQRALALVDWIYFTLLLARDPLLLATLLSHTKPSPRVH